jgi:hypothetical protein
MERVMGIEPTFEAWEAPVLPLNYTRVWQQSVSLQATVAGSHHPTAKEWWWSRLRAPMVFDENQSVRQLCKWKKVIPLSVRQADDPRTAKEYRAAVTWAQRLKRMGTLS